MPIPVGQNTLNIIPATDVPQFFHLFAYTLIYRCN